MEMTIVEKILARASGKNSTAAGEIVIAKPDMAFVPDGLPYENEKAIQFGLVDGLPKVWDPEKVVVVLDHGNPYLTYQDAVHYKKVRELVKKFGIKHFYGINHGIGHTIMTEYGHVRPGELILGRDSHTTYYGALNACGIPIGISEFTYVLLTGELWLRVPETIKIEITGVLPDLVLPKDIFLYIAGKYGSDVAMYKSIEWTGSAVEDMSIDGRRTLSCQSIELGAKCGIFEADEKTINFLKNRTDKTFTPVKSDPDALYEKEYTINASELEPQVAIPHGFEVVKPVSEVEGVKIDAVHMGTCSSGLLDDIRITARILQDKKIHPDIRVILNPASWGIYKEALKKGYLTTLIDAGVVIANPSCGVCRAHMGNLAPGETCIASTTRNFKGRMGSPEAKTYLASPATCAASAISGFITDPRKVN